MMTATMTNSNLSSESKETVAIPYKVLQGLIARKVSGRLTIRDPNDESVKWIIYLGYGKIHYARSITGQRPRIIYLLSQCYANHDLYIPQDLDDDYQFMCRNWQNGRLDLPKVRSLLSYMTREALIFFLATPRATINFHKVVGLDPLIFNLSLKSLVEPIKHEIRSWVQLRQTISSPFVRPKVKNWGMIEDYLGREVDEIRQLKQLKPYLDDHCTLYEVAAYSHRPLFDLALFLRPLIELGLIEINPFQKQVVIEKPLIACIDDSQAIQRIVKMTLMAGGFDVIGITEPSKAMSTFVRQKPDLILMDINMPEIDGYKLAYMLRQSTLLKDIPILMLTGRDGVLDRVKAKMVGAEAYICKPFNPQELVESVQNNLQKK